ncbi:hypothetical protein K435DRAFT_792147 [Dendrothele bispora CBS 962.96]|uniref:Uncharacterized protein n=1 Tax=Dendrothele bispora (strain CBS 962.96) TaxID=1314807 RepID=A0A4S8MK11_DENBC|nr:hypothetical protein K435DRAFT_792147 [Dendrothele bispora CBS 962.96]
MDVEDKIIQIPFTGYNPPNVREYISLITGLQIGLDLMERLNYIVGDIVVVWRAWVLFPRQIPAKIALSICLMGSFAGVSLDTGLLVKGVMKSHSDAWNKSETMILAVPLIFTNLTATALIGLKAWYHFQNIQNNLGSTNGSSKSGFLYLAFWIAYLVLGLTQDNDTTASQAYQAIMPELVAIYPVLIILLVAHEDNKPENLNDMSLSQSIRFASAQASESEVHHSESRGSPS